jgi:UDP-N-acetylglucosamine acyltransferase
LARQPVSRRLRHRRRAAGFEIQGEPTRLRIGDHNVFREHVTVHRSTKPDAETVIGSHNFFMANSHVAHNCVVGDHVILANGALLGGHAVVQDRAFISGNCLVHQFTRVGTLAMMQGGAAISQDLPPFTIARGDNEICGLNVVGLRRAGFHGGTAAGIEAALSLLFRSGKNLREALAAAQKNFTSAPAKVLLDFIAEAKRGVCADSGRAAGQEERRRIESASCIKSSERTEGIRAGFRRAVAAVDCRGPRRKPDAGVRGRREGLDFRRPAAGIRQPIRLRRRAGLRHFGVGACCCCGFPFNLLGLVFSLIALSQISRHPELYEGRGLAIAGLVLSAVSLLFFGAVAC